jgi:hypothetical protein
MKTAMQEAIEHFKNINYDLVNVPIQNVPHILEQFLEKEKEQIIEAGNACSIKTIVHREKLDEMSKDKLRYSLVEDTISHGEEYYTQTYNQNK